MEFTVDSSRCTGCGLCVSDCVTGLLQLKEGRPVPGAHADRRCIGCGHCLAICPTGSITLNGVPASECPAPGALPNATGVANLIAARRSVRRYRNVPVPRETIERMLRVVSSAPTAVNRRRLVFAVFSGEAMERLRREANGALLTAIRENTLSGAQRELRLLRPMIEAGQDVLFRNAPHLVVAGTGPQAMATDAVIALTSFELLALAQGIATVWDGFAMIAFSSFAAGLVPMLGFPEEVTPAAAMAFGYPAVTYPRLPPRAPYPVHFSS